MKQSIVIGIIGLLVGAGLGFWLANTINRDAALVATSQTTNIAMPGQPANGQPADGASVRQNVAEALDQAENEPNNFAAQMKAGDMYSQIGKKEEAIALYQKGVAIEPKNRQALITLANTYFDLKQFENAEKQYSKALEIDPNDVNARTDLATTFVERQPPDFDRAIKEFETSLKMAPTHEPTLYNLGVAYFRKGDVAKAKEIASEIEKINAASVMAQRLREFTSK